MRIRVSYCKNIPDGCIFACILVPIVSTKNLFVDPRSGILYERETLKLSTPKSYVLNFIRSASKHLNKNTALKIIEEQLKNGSELGRSKLDIVDSTELFRYDWLDDLSVRKEVIDIDEGEIVDMVNKYVREEEEW